jgi:hypothetical protein
VIHTTERVLVGIASWAGQDHTARLLQKQLLVPLAAAPHQGCQLGCVPHWPDGVVCRSLVWHKLKDCGAWVAPHLGCVPVCALGRQASCGGRRRAHCMVVPLHHRVYHTCFWQLSQHCHGLSQEQGCEFRPQRQATGMQLPNQQFRAGAVYQPMRWAAAGMCSKCSLCMRTCRVLPVHAGIHHLCVSTVAAGCGCWEAPVAARLPCVCVITQQ